MKRMMLCSGWLAIGVVGLGLKVSVALANNSPVGYWKMIDDKTKQPSSIVQVFFEGKELRARVVRLLNLKPGESPDPLCTKCQGERKNQRVIGMTFMWGLKETDKANWKGGQILDPDEGKIYGCKVWLTAGGRELKVSGCIWIFCRAQSWLRVPDSQATQPASPVKRDAKPSTPPLKPAIPSKTR